MSSTFAYLIILDLLAITLPTHVQSQAVKDILARAGAVYSCVAEYDVIPSFPPEAPAQQMEYRALVSGDHWVLASRRTGWSQRTAFGLFADVFAADELSTTVSVRIQAGKAFNETNPPLPVVFGTVWYDSTRKYLSENAASAVKRDRVRIGEFQCDVFDWQVPHGKMEAFGSYSSRLEVNGGVLRLYAASRLGYALPRIEYLLRQDGEEKLEQRYESNGFVEAAEGIFLPSSCVKQYFNDGKKTFECAVENIRWEYVNEEIPERALQVHVPFRTVIVDERDKRRQYSFETVATLPEDLRPLFSDTPIPQLPPLTPKTGFSALLWVGILLGFILIIALIRVLVRRSPATTAR